MKRILQLLILLTFSNVVFAQAGFESGTTAGWTTSGGDVTVVGTTSLSPGGGKNWTITPYGTKMAQLYPSGSTQFDAATTQLGLTSAENTAIRNYLTFQSQSGGGDPTPTNASWIKREVTLQAGTTYTFAWNYLSTDYTPYNDGSMMTLTHATNASITPNLNNSVQRYALLGFTNPGTGNYATDSYGSTGWQQAVFTVPETGTYVLGFASFNLGDTVLSPMLFIDEVQGTTALNGQYFGPVAPNAGSTAPSSQTPPPPPPPQFCCGGSSSEFTKDPANVSKVLTFDVRPTADSKVFIEQIGNQNEIFVQQTGTKNNYTKYVGNGSFNSVSIEQSSTTTSATNYTDLGVTGNNNSVTITQQSTGGSKGAFVSISNSNNTLLLNQKDSGNHYAEVNLSGGNKNVDILQQGSAGHMARIGLTGLPTELSLTQSGSTQNFYSINFNCTTSGGCAKITVTQGQ